MMSPSEIDYDKIRSKLSDYALVKNETWMEALYNLAAFAVRLEQQIHDIDTRLRSLEKTESGGE